MIYSICVHECVCVCVCVRACVRACVCGKTLLQEGTYLTIVVNLRHGPQTISNCNKTHTKLLKVNNSTVVDVKGSQIYQSFNKYNISD